MIKMKVRLVRAHANTRRMRKSIAGKEKALILNGGETKVIYLPCN